MESFVDRILPFLGMICHSLHGWIRYHTYAVQNNSRQLCDGKEKHRVFPSMWIRNGYHSEDSK